MAKKPPKPPAPKGIGSGWYILKSGNGQAYKANGVWTLGGTAASVDRDGKTAWTTPGKALLNTGIAEQAESAWQEVPSLDYTDWLRITNWGFSLPAGAVIRGIEVQIFREANHRDDILDHAIYLRKTSGRVGDNYANTVDTWARNDEAALYGGTGDLWNTTWTKADIESSDFGIDISVENLDGSDPSKAFIYSVSINIEYTSDGDTGWVLSGNVINVDLDGKEAWNNPANAEVDNEDRSEVRPELTTYTDYLWSDTYGFTADDVPLGATIIGIEVWYRIQGQNDMVSDYITRLVDGDGNIVGDNKADDVRFEDISYGAAYVKGGAADTWNAGLTQVDIVDSQFGFVVSVECHSAGESRAWMYAVGIKVYFSPEAGGETPGPYKLKYRKSGATVEITTYEAAGIGWNEALAIEVNSTEYYAQLDTNTSHAKASDLRVRIDGVTYAVLTEEGTPT